MKKIFILSFAFILYANYLDAQTYDIVVAQDGSGDYTTVQAAINAAPSGSSERKLIYIKNGTYYEVLNIGSNKINLTFQGESRDGVKLTYDNAASKINPATGSTYGTSGSSSMFIDGDGFYAKNLSFENSADPSYGQAVAVRSTADKVIFQNCRFLGNQDTYYAHSGRGYYVDCYFEGTTDFIFGSAIAFFENCSIYSKGGTSLTAASTPEYVEFGYIFNNCSITGAGSQITDLGRPWRPYASVTFMNSYISDVIKPQGWNNWGDAANEATARFAEYNNTGTGADFSGRPYWITYLSASQATNYNMLNVLKANDSNPQVVDNWDPATVIEDLPATLTKHGAGSSSQTVEVNTPIVEFYYGWENATSVTVTGLPTGVTATINTTNQTVTISGTPVVTGTFNYTITTVGGSPNANVTNTITVTGTGSANSITIQENQTGFCGVDGTVDNNNAGFTGDGFANTSNASGNGIDYKVNFSNSGTYIFTFIYASTSDRPANIIINGSTAVSSLSFPSTGSWTTWATVSASAYVNAGIYDVRLEATGSSGLANIDYMQITGSTPSAADCNGSTVTTYTLTTNTSGSGSVSGAGTYNEGTTVTLTASPASGYEVSSWSGVDASNGNTATVTMNSNRTVTVIFTQITTSGNITVRARGAVGGEQIELNVGGSTVATWTLTTSYQDYSASGSGTASVYFTNDNGDYDVQVDYIVNDGITYQAEDQATNTGVWQNSQCGGSYSEWLNCNGYILFDTPEGSSSPVTLTIQEDGTGFCSVDGSVDNNNSGYTGSGFANTDNASGNGITWSVNIPSTGNYDLAWRYSNGGSTDRTAQLMVDGLTVVSSVSMPSTGSWTSWTSTSGTTVSLSAGTRLIRLQATNSSGLSNIDYMSITGVSPTAVSCTGLKQTGKSLTNNLDIEVYPNPVQGNIVNISGILEINSEMNIVVYNEVGQIVSTKNMGVVEQGSFVESLLINTQSGIYFIKVVTDCGVEIVRFVKE